MSLTRHRWTLAVLLLAACSRSVREPGEAKAPGQSVTHFTDRTELFVEFPALVKDRESAFAVHLTRLDDFKPVTEGRVALVLSGGGKPEERFEVERPTVPGIFRPVAKPGVSGERKLDVVVLAGGGEDRHELGKMRVFETLEDAREAEPPEDAGQTISFLKEQQWKTEFATAPVATRKLRGAVLANGILRARSDGDARVTAPVAGRLGVGSGALPEIGKRVRRNDALAILHPLVGREADLPSLEQTVTRARLALDLARRERERVEKLLAEEAVPERRAAAARNDEQAAEADLKAAERRLRQHARTQRADAGTQDRLTVRAPMDGSVVEVRAAPGVLVEAGAELFRIVDLERLWLEVRIPEAEIARVRQATSASFRVPGFDGEFEAGDKAGGRAIGLGGVLDPASRTVPLLFEVPNPKGDLRVGMSATVRVFTTEVLDALAVPVSAVIDEGGKDVAYVEAEGEAFERRVLALGVRDGEWVQVLEGLSAGERLVTRGAYEIRLAASSSAVPAHGHVH